MKSTGEGRRLHQSRTDSLDRAPEGRAPRRAAVLNATEIVTVPIATLLPGDSPRSEGPDHSHVAQLAELDGPLAPILVHSATMRVIDGMHRYLATLRKGLATIDVEFFDGTSEEAFLRAVEANAAHGLPLSQVDRRTAAERIIMSHPHMSDRAIAKASGLGTRTVAAIRRRLTDSLPQLGVRVGRDGKTRPLDSTEGRRRAAQAIAENPGASLREIARLAGISPATVSDVRRRIESGEDAVLGHGATAVGGKPAKAAAETPTTRAKAERRVRDAQLDPVSVIEKLLRDPSLRHKEEGRHLLRLLQHNAVQGEELARLTSAVPPHCGGLVVNLARQYSNTWREFAQELDDRVRSIPVTSVAE
nr:ParB N-terminal domain-containing protein [Streptomyces sp. RLB1-33]